MDKLEGEGEMGGVEREMGVMAVVAVVMAVSVLLLKGGGEGVEGEGSVRGGGRAGGKPLEGRSCVVGEDVGDARDEEGEPGKFREDGREGEGGQRDEGGP